MLRGAFGNALKRTVCVMPAGQKCEMCMLRKQCVYTRIFETFIEDEPPPFLRGMQTSPRPYIIDPEDRKAQFNKDDSFHFNMTLLGQVCELHPYVIFAVSQMAARGLAAKRAPFDLTKAYRYKYTPEDKTIEEHLLYRGDTQCLCEAATPTLDYPGDKLKPPITLKFLTPTRLKFKSKYSMDFTFRMLVFKMLRRVLEIAHFHVPDANINWEFHDYLVAADKIQITERNLHWQDWHRYSSRQHTKMEMGGFVGEIVLDGDVAPFSELLRVCEVVHVGKGAGFGLGKMNIL